MRIKLNDLRLFFDTEGLEFVPHGDELRRNPTLILLHGGPGGDHSTFKPAFSQMSAIARLIYLDLRGNGRSDRSEPQNWNLKKWSSDLLEFCEALEIESPIILGQSFGGFVAMVYAASYPSRLSKLVLASTSARFVLERKVVGFQKKGGERAANVARAYWSGMSEEMAGEYERVCRPLYNTTPAPPYGGSWTVRNMEVGAFFNNGEYQQMDLREQLGLVRCPTLVLVGEEDPNTTVEDAEEIMESLSNAPAQLVRIVGAGHGVWRDNPDEAFMAIKDFIKS